MLFRKGDEMKTLVQLKVTMANELLGPFLQHVRDFDVANPGCHFEIFATAPDLPTEEVRRILERIDPPFPAGVKVVSR